MAKELENKINNKKSDEEDNSVEEQKSSSKNISEIAQEEIINAVLSEILEQEKSEDRDSDDEESFFNYDKFIHGKNPNPIYLNGKVLDYDEIFSHLGHLETKNFYDGMKKSETSGSAITEEESSHTILTEEDIAVAVRAEKLFTPGFKLLGNFGMVPPDGMSAEKWETYKLDSIIQPHMVQIRMKLN